MKTQMTAGKSPMASDSDLVAAIRAGDMGAMEALMRRNNRLLYRTARAILRDDAEAEDAVQEAYIKAYRALDTFRSESKLSTWLVRIVANVALMRRRQNAKGATIVPINDIAEPDKNHEEAVSDDAGPEKEAILGDVRRLLEARIDALPDAYREIFMLRAIEEFSVEETAAALGIPEATVRTRYFRARSLLRESLARDVDFALGEVFGFAGSRCDRIVRKVLSMVAPASPASWEAQSEF